MKKVIIIVLILLAVFFLWNQAERFASQITQTDLKPIIYLYPEKETDVTVKLDYDGKLTTTYPSYGDGWKVTAYPDGTLRDKSGREYYGLFWEGESDYKYDLSKGFVVKGSETEKFLEDSLSKLGLTDKEANEFIVFWLPKMENNKYNFISFQGKNYTDSARLEISPEPDSVLRIFMAWKPLDKKTEVKPQVLEAPARKGFTVVEWGGTILE